MTFFISINNDISLINNNGKNIAIYLFSSDLFQRTAKLKFLNARIANRFIANTKVK